MRRCEVYVHGKYAGILTEVSSDDYRFAYDEDYLDQADSYPVCLAMPLSKVEYKSPVLFPYFFNMLSEGANRRIQSELLHIDENDNFGILLATAQYDTVGSVTIKPQS